MKSTNQYNSNYPECEKCKTAHCCYFPPAGLIITLNDVASIINAANEDPDIFKKEYRETIQEILNEKNWVDIKYNDNNYVAFLLSRENCDGIPRHRSKIAFPCYFLDIETHKCMIYPVRPEICRNWNCGKAKEPIEIDFDLL
ncbi:MAG: YkgJ family cysteine cluster protein [Candidatus Aenigmarchaeota archaeon]|nr:YkgJ family cysteine cluster protein [Candidatus Aenigmarchaeota archaeon]